MIGPGIGPCCFEIQKDLELRANTEFAQFHDIIIKDGQGRCTWDLPNTIYQMLLERKIKEENIAWVRQCTSCHGDWFYSYRRDKGTTGRMGAILGLRD
jgi:copper oxidase (laccase) domain-containing protein